MGFFNNWLIKRALNKAKQHSKPEISLEDELAETSKQYLQTLREMEKTQKILEARRRISNLKDATTKLHKKITEIDEDDEEEEEDEEEDEEDYKDDDITNFLTDMAKRTIMNKINPSGSLSGVSNTPPSSSETTPLKSLAKSKINEYIDTHSDTELMDIVQKFVK